MNCVPLMSDSPSFAWSRTGVSPAAASASAPGMRTPVDERLALADERQREVRERREIAARTDRAAGRHERARSRASRTASSSSTVSTRAPEYPFAIAFARSSIAARTTSSGYGSPTPQAWLRSRRSCSSSAWSSGIDSETKRPNPVLTP